MYDRKEETRVKKILKLADIIIKDNFLKTTPSSIKLNRCRDFYKQFGRTDKSILVDKNNVLLDNYIRYLVLRENNVESVTVNVLRDNYFDINTFYVFGRHPCSKREYVWRLPHDKLSDADKYKVGGRALVRTKHGVKEIIITKTLQSLSPPVKTPIRKVIKCL